MIISGIDNANWLLYHSVVVLEEFLLKSLIFLKHVFILIVKNDVILPYVTVIYCLLLLLVVAGMLLLVIVRVLQQEGIRFRLLFCRLSSQVHFYVQYSTSTFLHRTYN